MRKLTMTMRNGAVSTFAAMVLWLSIPEARAVEGAVQYPHGAEGLLAGALPPPGTYFLAYGIRYSGVRQGDDGSNLSVGGNKVELRVDALALRVLHVSGFRILGGLWSMHAVVPLFNNSVTVGSQTNNNTGLGDIVVDPFVLSWHRPTVHYAVGLDVVAPTGAYDQNRPLGNNIGANYWSFEPIVAVTWMPGAGFEADVKAMYNIKTTNTATQYRSGDELHMDFTLGRSFGETLRAGLGGYLDVQMQADQVDGVEVPNGGNKARYLGLGPEIAYHAGPTIFIGKWQTEVWSRNAFRGDRFIVKLVTPF